MSWIAFKKHLCIFLGNFGWRTHNWTEIYCRDAVIKLLNGYLFVHFRHSNGKSEYGIAMGKKMHSEWNGAGWKKKCSASRINECVWLIFGQDKNGTNNASCFMAWKCKTNRKKCVSFRWFWGAEWAERAERTIRSWNKLKDCGIRVRDGRPAVPSNKRQLSAFRAVNKSFQPNQTNSHSHKCIALECSAPKKAARMQYTTKR